MNQDTIIPKKPNSSLQTYLAILKTIKIELIIYLLFILAIVFYDIYLFQEKITLFIGIPFVTLITIRMKNNSLKKIWLTNLFFGCMVGAIDGFLSWFAHWFPERYSDDGFAKLAAPIFILIFCCLAGSIALLWGWIVQLFIRIFKYMLRSQR